MFQSGPGGYSTTPVTTSSPWELAAESRSSERPYSAEHGNDDDIIRSTVIVSLMIIVVTSLTCHKQQTEGCVILKFKFIKRLRAERLLQVAKTYRRHKTQQV